MAAAAVGKSEGRGSSAFASLGAPRLRYGGGVLVPQPGKLGGFKCPSLRAAAWLRAGGGIFLARLRSAAWHRVPGEQGGCGTAGLPVCWADALFFLPFPPPQPHDIRAQVSAARIQAPGARAVSGITLAVSAASWSSPTRRLTRGQALGWLVPAAPPATESHRVPCAGSQPRCQHGAACPRGRVMPAEPQQSGKTKVLGALKCN